MNPASLSRLAKRPMVQFASIGSRQQIPGAISRMGLKLPQHEEPLRNALARRGRSETPAHARLDGGHVVFAPALLRDLDKASVRHVEMKQGQDDATESAVSGSHDRHGFRQLLHRESGGLKLGAAQGRFSARRIACKAASKRCE